MIGLFSGTVSGGYHLRSFAGQLIYLESVLTFGIKDMTIFEAYQPLFDHMKGNHNIILVKSEMDEIIRVCDFVMSNINDPAIPVSSLKIDPMSEKINGEFIYCHCEEILIDRSKSGILSCKNCGKPIK